MVVKVNALDHIVINVADVAVPRSGQKVLGMENQGVSIRARGKTPRTSLMSAIRRSCAAAGCRQGRVVHGGS